MSTEDRMRALMTGYRRDIAPRASDRVRVWERLEAEAPDAHESRARPRAVVIAGLVALAAAIVLLAMRAAPDRSAQLREHESSSSVYEATPASETPTVRRDAPRASAPTSPAPPVIAVEPEPPRPAPMRRAASVKPAPVHEDPLHAELRVIEAARAALERGDHELALARAGEHRRRFPQGALALEARSLRALALCGAGRWMQGRGEARALLSDDATSPYRDRLREACDLR